MLGIAQPIIEDEEINAVHAVLLSGMLAQGPQVAELEVAFAAECGTNYAVAVNSGTAAIHAALYAAGIGQGDEVITTPFTFIATINPILAVGATPVLVDIDSETFNIDYLQVEAAITKHTKAIIAVDLYGQPCDYDELRKIAKLHNLVIIEDACQAIGAEYRDSKAGALGDIGCFSLYATKNIMSGEGGVITTNNKDYADAARRFRQHGMSAPYEYEHFGLNYRMSDLHAAIAIEQLKKLSRFTAARRANAKLYTAALKNLKSIVTPIHASNRTHVYHQYTIRILNDNTLSRDELAEHLRANGIIPGVYYPKPLHYYKHIKKLGYKKGDFPIAERASREVLSLPVHPLITPEDVSSIVSVINTIG